MSAAEKLDLAKNTEIRKATERDCDAVWNIVKAVIDAGDTYVFAPDTPKDEMMNYWFSPEKYNYVAVTDGNVVGTFWLKANQPGLGSHVANAAYAVLPDAAGQGIGRQMADFSIDEARKLGFKAMQFNFVVKSNGVAVRLWQNVGFEIIGEIPDAFDHVRDGLTNAYIMYRKL